MVGPLLFLLVYININSRSEEKQCFVNEFSSNDWHFTDRVVQT